MSIDPFPGSELSVILVVSDLRKSHDFYINKLGAVLFREYGGSTLVCNFLGTWLVLVTEGEPTADKPELSFKNSDDQSQVDHSFTIRVADCTNSYQILKELGVEFITSPYRWENELRCFFKDPDGHLFEISQVEGLGN